MILFWVCAAGKNGRTAARCLDSLLTDIGGTKHPFKAIREYWYWCMATPQDPIPFRFKLKEHGIGCYSNKARTMVELAHSKLNLKTCTTDDLESIYGIGFKTARCFILHSRKDARVAGLDTHILKHLRALGYDAPFSTPSTKKQYLTFEKIVLSLADDAGMSPADYDLMVWNKYSVKVKEN
jgi:thermostable 8-oxoguanine DNA glycosylase